MRCGQHHVRLINFIVQILFTQDVAHQAAAIVCVVNGEVGGIVELMAFDAKYFGEDGMEGSIHSCVLHCLLFGKRFRISLRPIGKGK